MTKSAREEELSRWLAKLGPQLRDRLRIPADLRGQVSPDDVMQEAYLAAFVAIERMPTDERAIPAWLGSIVRNLLVDAVRALRAEKRGGGRRISVAEPRGESVYGAHGTTPSRHVGRMENADRVRRTVGKLPEPYRTAAISLLAGEKAAVLAERLGKSIGATHMLLSRTRKLMRTELPGGSDLLDSR